VHTAEEKAQDRRANRPVHAPLEQQQHQHPPVDVIEPRWRSRTNTNERVREQLVREHGPGSASAANEHNAHERTGVREQCSRTLANAEHCITRRKVHVFLVMPDLRCVGSDARARRRSTRIRRVFSCAGHLGGTRRADWRGRGTGAGA